MLFVLVIRESLKGFLVYILSVTALVCITTVNSMTVQSEALVVWCCGVGVRPLHLAVEGGHEDVVSCLIERGCNVNEPSFDGTTPLHIACECGHLAIVSCSVTSNTKLMY